MERVINTQAEHCKSIEEFLERATNLYGTYYKGKVSIDAVYSSGWEMIILYT